MKTALTILALLVLGGLSAAAVYNPHQPHPPEPGWTQAPNNNYSPVRPTRSGPDKMINQDPSNGRHSAR